MYPIKTRMPYNPESLGASMNTYTTVYLGNYVSGDVSENVGSHPGVDIVPMTKNDNVVAVLPGIVHFSWANASEGEYIVIRHENVPAPGDFSKTTTLYSNYLHLSSRSVNTGDIVGEGTIIGKTGNTGQSTGEHLHFQIDTKDAPFHPYWPFTFAEAKELGLGFFEAVNRAVGIEKGRKFTVNPLVYLDELEMSGKTVTPFSSSNTSDSASKSSSNTITITPEKETSKVATNTSSGTLTVAPFADVSATYVYAKAIAYVKAEGIAIGSGGKFRPEASVTRAEILKMAFTASKTPLSSDVAPHFTDVSIDNPFLSYINTAREKGIISGFSDGTFRGDDTVTRAEALKMVLGVLGIGVDKHALGAYSDISPTDWVAPYASWAKTHVVFADVNQSILQPNTPMKRAEVASLIYRAKMG